MSGFRVQMNTIIISIHHMWLGTAFVFGKCALRETTRLMYTQRLILSVCLYGI